MLLPLIGITVHPDDDADRTSLDYLLALIVEGVERAGGAPVLIPLNLRADTLRALYQRLDGVLFSGGGDMQPELYSATPHATMGGVSAERDRVEMSLMRWSVDEAKPFFGICRGAQVMNVTLGGTLYRDISEYIGAHKHTYDGETAYTLRPHAVQVVEESTLAHILGQPMVTVNSLHHQAVREVAPGVAVSARAADGLVEAIELPQHPFALAVQWHPECLLDAPEMLGIFKAFVQAAGKRSDTDQRG
ncbi:MAG: gamma-glutamyl-gamma-aminobutyrate hydrolase family protein [Anaerolineales bacterium]